MTEYGTIGNQPGQVPQNNVTTFLDEHARRIPGRTALCRVPAAAMAQWDGVQPLAHESVNYGELASSIVRIAGGLKELGIGKGDRVIIFVPLSVELYQCMFAVQRLGAIAVFLDSWARRDQLGVSARVVEPKAMISFEKAFDLCVEVPELARIPLKVVVGPHEKQYAAGLDGLLGADRKSNVEPVRADDTALITFTTGSSGVPKGANRTHRFLAAQHRALDKEIPYREGDRDLPVFPIFSLNNLAGGVTTVLPAIDLAAPSDRDAPVIINQIFSEKVTCCTVSPSIFVKMAEHCRASNITLTTLRRVVTGGAPVSRDNVRAFTAIAPGAEVLVLYGSTEVEPIAHIAAKEMLEDAPQKQGVNVGRISKDLRYKFIRITRGSITLGPDGWRGWEAEAGKPGELIVSGDHVCADYYNNPGAFKAAKIREADGRVWHRTGDVGVMDEQGRLWLIGRVHNTIVRDGQYLFPVHAEILLKRLDFVRQAAFLGIDDAALGEKTYAVFSLKSDADPSRTEAYAAGVRELFKSNDIPLDDVRVVAEVPMDPRHHSKVEYAKLREMLDA